MIIPPKTNSYWKTLILGEDIPQLHALPTKLLLMRVRLLARDKTPQKIEEAIEIAYDFFLKNQSIVQEDIKILFGAIDQIGANNE